MVSYRKGTLYRGISLILVVAILFTSCFSWTAVTVQASPLPNISGLHANSSLSSRHAYHPPTILPEIPASMELTPSSASLTSTLLSVSRIQSAVTPGGVVSNTLVVTFTVTNWSLPLPGEKITTTLASVLQPTPEDPTTARNVILTDKLAAGVTVLDASRPADRDGHLVLWSLGDIPPLTSVTLTIQLAIPEGLIGFVSLDEGASVYATHRNSAIAAEAAPIRLAPDEFANWLQATVDANIFDPYVLEQAGVLRQDALPMFAFVRDLRYEAYRGSLRGARGALWSEAANALDKSSLLIALLRGAGVPARYVHGTLNAAQTRELAAAMFPTPTTVIGQVPSGEPLADPVNNATILTEIGDHWWVEAYLEGAWVALDPSFPSATPGQMFAQSTTERLAEVPDDLRHKVTMTVKIEQ